MRAFHLIFVIILLYKNIWISTQAEISPSFRKSSPNDSYYVAGVVEFHSDEKRNFTKQLEGYKSIIASDEAKDTDIIVFSEGTFNTIDNATFVPDPNDKVVVCRQNLTSNETYDYSMINDISCLAQKHQKYIVINLSEKENCTAKSQLEKNDTRPCALDGLTRYNTDVVFDRNGTVIARYRKWNLYNEGITNSTVKPELVTFETDFGVKFGLITCFDILFYTPTQELVHSGIKDFIFPSMWYSELPFLTAVQQQQAWAYANNVNLLAAGASNPTVGSTGTGIYAGQKGALEKRMTSKAERKIYVHQVPKMNVTNNFAAVLFDNIDSPDTSKNGTAGSGTVNSSNGTTSAGQGSSNGTTSAGQGSSNGTTSTGQGSSDGTTSGSQGSSNGTTSGGQGSSNGTTSGGQGSSNATTSGGQGSSNGTTSGGQGSSNGTTSGGQGSSNGTTSGGQGSSNGTTSGGQGSSNSTGSSGGSDPSGNNNSTGSSNSTASSNSTDETVSGRLLGLSLLRDTVVNKYNVTFLNENELNVSKTLCYKSLCCKFNVSWILSGTVNNTSSYQYALAVYEGNRTYQKHRTSYIRTCSLIACTTNDIQNCGSLFKDNVTVANKFIFNKIEIIGNYTQDTNLTKIPLIMPTSLDETLLPLPVGEFEFTTFKHNINSNKVSNIVTYNLNATSKSNLLTFGIYSNDFENPNKIPKDKPSSSIRMSFNVITLAALLMIVFNLV